MDPEMKAVCDAWLNKTRDRIVYKGYWLLREQMINFHLTSTGVLSQPEFNEVMDYLKLPIKLLTSYNAALYAAIDTPWGIRDVEWYAYFPEILDPNYA